MGGMTSVRFFVDKKIDFQDFNSTTTFSVPQICQVLKLTDMSSNHTKKIFFEVLLIVPTFLGKFLRRN